MKDFMGDFSEICDLTPCQTKIVITGVNGSDLVPLRKVKLGPKSSYDKKRERRERHLKQMLRTQARSGGCFDGMVSAIMEMATNSSELVDKTLLELYRQVMEVILMWF